MLLLPSAKHKRIHFKSLFLLLLVKKSSYQPGFFKLPFLFFNSQSLLFHLIRWDLMQRLCQHFTEHRLDMHNAFPKESKVAKQTLVIIMESIMHSFTMTEWSTTLTPKCKCGELTMEHWRLTQELLRRSLHQHMLPLWLPLLQLPQSHSPIHLQDPACYNKNIRVTELVRKTKLSRHTTS